MVTNVISEQKNKFPCIYSDIIKQDCSQCSYYFLFHWHRNWYCDHHSETIDNSNCVLISEKFELGRSLIRKCAIKTKDRNKRHQRKKERIVKVSRYTCIISFVLRLSELVSETIILDIMKLQLLLYMFTQLNHILSLVFDWWIYIFMFLFITTQ
jgi:hypothetical protein